MPENMTRLGLMTAVTAAVFAGEPDSAPSVEMGRGMRADGGQGMQGQGMQMRDGSGPECTRTQPATGDDAETSSIGMDR